MSILDELNPAQREAAATVEGPLLVLAGAGSGKTRVLTYRIAYLIQEMGVEPWQILAVTFTNKAAGEMRERVEKLVGDMARDIWIGTFHSICARFLRVEAENFGLERSFSIYDEDDRRAAIRRVFESHKIDDKDLTPRSVIAQISRAKNAMLDPASFAAEAGEAPNRKLIAELYTAYEADLRRNNALDFDDLLVETVRQFDNHPEILDKYQRRFHFSLVDEYQDTNRPQYMLCRQLAAHHRNFCVVGDDDQSIYQFRGADLRNILDFERDYPDAKTVRLEQNYRSTARILEAANQVIANNKDRKGKKLWTDGPDGELIELVQCDTDRREARFVVETLKRQVGSGGFSPGDAAILYRTNAQSRSLEEELQRSGMPYTIVGSTRFYERREIKDLLAYLRILTNPADDIGLRRVINMPRRGIGDTSLDHLQRYALNNGLNLFSAMGFLEQVEGLNARAQKHMGEFKAIIDELAAVKDELTLPELGQRLFERSGYQQMLIDENSPEAEARAQNVEQLIAFMTEFSETRDEATLDSFLEEVALMSPMDEAGDTSRMITLMTLHSAKGLEYPLVFMCGMEENLFPTARAVEESRSRQNPQAIEEERRLCYVGITRARQRLYLTYANRRYAYGNMIDCEPSRFLQEIPDELYSVKREVVEFNPRTRQPGRNRFADGNFSSAGSGNRSGAPVRKKVTAPKPKGVHYEWDEGAQPQTQLDAFADFVDSDDFLAVGQWVRHASWGRGQIIARDGYGENMKLSIRFGPHVKKVAVAYAQLEPA
jgi:DNA helicase II / ATP-dependent DNA helicase PcrA